MSKDTSKTGPQKPESDSAFHSVQAELERTRFLLRQVLNALLDDGYTFYREGPILEWWNEDVRRPKVEA